MARKEETHTYISGWGDAFASPADLQMLDRLNYSKKELARQVAQAQEGYSPEKFGDADYWASFPTAILMVVYSDMYVPGDPENREWMEQLIGKRPKKRKSPKKNTKTKTKQKGVRGLVSSALK